LILTTIASCALCGCATSPPLSSGGGHEEPQFNAEVPTNSPVDYEDHQIDNRSFEVWGHATGDNSPSRSAHAAMRRAAQLTIAHGMDGFTMVVDGQPPITCAHQGEGTAKSTTCSPGSGKVILPSAHFVFWMMSAEEGVAARRVGHMVYDAGRILGDGPRMPP
jgi:hypothetical protein